MDFCAWMEVWLDGRWWTFDPRNNQHRKGRVVIGRGRDAVDVAMVTTYGFAPAGRDDRGRGAGRMNQEERALLANRPDTDALAAAEVVRYRLRQRFAYTYEGRAYDLRHRLVVVPPSVHGDQRLRLGSVEVTSPDAEVVWRGDEDGNRTTIGPARRRARDGRDAGLGHGRARRRERGAVLERAARHPDAAADAADPAGRGAALAGPRARRGRCRGDRRARSAPSCPRWSSYEYGHTGVDTTAAEALAGGVGVCQDQAHVMLAMCRSVGVRARYVSGHLIGQGGTHAWVEILVPDGLGARADRLRPVSRPPRRPAVRDDRDRPRLPRRGTDVGLVQRRTPAASSAPAARCPPRSWPEESQQTARFRAGRNRLQVEIEDIEPIRPRRRSA